MADYREISKIFPAIEDFLRNQALIRLRGDVLAYAGDIRTPSFSTDSRGFRHTMLNGQSLSIVDCVTSGHYGLVLGASNSFGFGVEGNENTMASRLSQRFGYPFANCAMPGASSRNLNSVLIAIIAGAPRPPSTVILSSGGDLATFCNASYADPVFGSPNRNQIAAEFDRGRAPPDPEPHFRHLLSFTSLWAEVIARTCLRQGAKLLMVHQSTFFETSEPTPRDEAFRLGVPLNVHEARSYANHVRFNGGFFAKRKAVADHLGVPLAGWRETEQLTFVDEFHLDRDSTRKLSENVGGEIEKLAGL